MVCKMALPMASVALGCCSAVQSLVFMVKLPLTCVPVLGLEVLVPVGCLEVLVPVGCLEVLVPVPVLPVPVLGVKLPPPVEVKVQRLPDFRVDAVVVLGAPNVFMVNDMVGFSLVSSIACVGAQPFLHLPVFTSVVVRHVANAAGACPPAVVTQVFTAASQLLLQTVVIPRQPTTQSTKFSGLVWPPLGPEPAAGFGKMSMRPSWPSSV